MARKPAAWVSLSLRACARAALLCALACPTLPARAQEPVKGQATLTASGGFARLLLTLEDDVDTDVATAGNVLIVRFKRPVDLVLDRVTESATDYIASARRDPDGMAVRFALARKVSVNTMAAGERTFVDLLPTNWNGPPPGLPQQVIRELAERARVAERALKAQRAAQEVRKKPTLRMRASVQPTFVRFSIDLPDGVGVSSALGGGALTLSFTAPLLFDLADAKLAAPPAVASIASKAEPDGTGVTFALVGDVDVRSFRDDRAYVVDVMAQRKEKPPQLPAAAARPVSTGPAMPQLADADAEIAPPSSDSIARLATPAAAEKPIEAARIDAPKVEPVKIEQPKTDAPKADTPIEKPADKAALPAAPALAAPAMPTPAVPARAVDAPPPAPAAPPPAPAAPSSSDTGVTAQRSSDALRLTFAFPKAVPAALFRRADVMWLVVDGVDPIDIAPIRRDSGALIADVSLVKLDGGQAIRMRLTRPQLAALAPAGAGGTQWQLTFADSAQAAPLPLAMIRNVVDPAHAKVTVPLQGAGRLHRLADADIGDTVNVVTALAPARGFIRRQDFVEFSMLETAHGVAVVANADDVAVEVLAEGVVLSRPGGLTLSASLAARERAAVAVRPVFDIHAWQENAGAPFRERRDALIAALAQAPAQERATARGELARFYFARGMYPEARGVVSLMLTDHRTAQDDAATLTMQAVAATLTDRPEEALRVLGQPVLSGNPEVQLWTGLALARQGRWAPAREKFKDAGFAIASLPFDLQRIALESAMRAAIESKDYAGAAARSSELDIVGVPDPMKPAVAVLRGRLAEAFGRDQDALSGYRAAAAVGAGPGAAEGKLREIALRQTRGEIDPDEALHDLETLSVTWRGDTIEVRTMQLLAKLYAAKERYADALGAARTATLLSPNSDIARQLQDDAATLFTQMYLTPRGDAMPPIEALAAFYDNRELTPIGRRGDEMIRRLVERLVAVDLLDQASELLQYQVDHRLEGAARAQIAARLAMIYLTNRKPERAIAALGATRIADLGGDLRQQRLLLEARAQSDIGRRDLALDIISNLAGREAVRLRADIYWGARRWREASEQIELYYGERWRDFRPLNASEKSDVLRALIGYALADDGLGLSRFREKYAPLMTSEADRAALDAASKPAAASATEFAAVARMAASVDTLEGFLREMKTRFPENMAKAAPAAEPDTTGTLPKIASAPRR